MAVSPRRRARTNRPTAWAKYSGVEALRGVHADREARHVDALGHHPHGDHPAARVARELLDARARLLLVGEHDGGLLPADALEDLRVRARDGLVGRDDEPARVGDAVPHLGRAGGRRPAAPRGSIRPSGSSAVRHA